MKVRSPRIKVSQEVDQKIRHWVDICNLEISGLGIVEETEEGYLVSDVFLLKQEVTSHDTELDDMAVAELQLELMKQEDGLQDKLLFWWHSHVRMDVYWSGTDEECIDKLVGDRYIISIVYNKKGESRCRIDYGWGPTRVMFDELDYEIEPAFTMDEILDEAYDAALEDFDPNKPVNLYDFSRKYAQNLEEFGILEHRLIDVDLGFKDFCQEEYDEKVTRKYGGYSAKGSHSTNTHNHWDQRKKHEEKKKKEEEKKKKEAAKKAAENEKKILDDGFDDFDDWESWIHNYESDTADEASVIQDVYEMMEENFRLEENWR